MSREHRYYKQNRLQQLRGFCHAARTGSISRAAREMSLTQPSVSLQIQALEREFGTSLFERNGPKIRLTPDGELLTSEASIGRVKRYTLDGKLLGLVGTYQDAAGCTHVAAAMAPDRTVYVIDLDHGTLRVLKPGSGK